MKDIIEKVLALPDHPMAYLVLQAPLQDFEHNGLRAADLKRLAQVCEIAKDAVSGAYIVLATAMEDPALVTSARMVAEDLHDALREISNIQNGDKAIVEGGEN